MTVGAGVIRSESGLSEAAAAIGKLIEQPADEPGTPGWEATNLVTVASALLAAATAREESRGAHWRRITRIATTSTGRAVWISHSTSVLCRKQRLYRAIPRRMTVMDETVDRQWVGDLVRATIEEDLAGGVDVTTTATVDPDQISVAELVARADGVVAGLEIAEMVLRLVAAPDELEIEYSVRDGASVRTGDILMTIRGKTRQLLTAERTALNLLCHLSGVATLTRRWVDAVADTGAVIRDTRKTMPLLRSLEKYAVRCGGGKNHRMGLSDAALIKDNHVIAAGGVAEAFRLVRKAYPDIAIEVEVDSVDDALIAVEAGAELILLDNMDVPLLREAVEKVSGRARLEASGGLTLDQARAVAETGVDFLAVGALTHSAPVLDIALDLKES